MIQHLRDTESLIRDAMQGVKCFLQGNRDSYRLLIPQPGDRLHEVLVEVNDGKDNDRFLSVFSVCGPADPAHYASALALNARLTYGSLSIRHVLGVPMFVMTRTFPRDRVRPSELRDAIIEIARPLRPDRAAAHAARRLLTPGAGPRRGPPPILVRASLAGGRGTRAGPGDGDLEPTLSRAAS